MSKNKLRLSVIKYNALKLRSSYQLPYYLVYLISKLNENDDINYVKYLMSSCEHLMRTKGYYKKYPSIEKEIEKQIKETINNRTYLNI